MVIKKLIRFELEPYYLMNSFYLLTSNIIYKLNSIVYEQKIFIFYILILSLLSRKKHILKMHFKNHIKSW